MKADDELLAAYVDGVAELTPEERQRVEAKLPELDAAGTRAMIDRLRALPAEGSEPDWRVLQATIRAAVDRKPWWRRLVVPAGVLAVGAAALAMYLHRGEPAPQPVAAAVVAPPAAPEPAPAQQTELWLDGHLVDVTGADPSVLYDGDDLLDEASLLPASDLRWVDQLDDRALDRAEQWLEKQKT